ncbi:MAG TPA: PspC domain-containing protein [Candidatus Kapabacteria bacterium]|nr:PspC domain-containing protein [Candidatus Kapabacteria bacterium]
MKKLFRSRTDKVFAGVCGGIAAYLNMDSTVIRLGTVFLCMITGFFPLGLLYIVACFIVPEEETTIV